MKALPLTDNQKAIIRENMDTMMDTSITALPGMEGTSARQVKDYRLKISRTENDALQLAAALESYIAAHGLPAQYGAVLPYITYLRS